VLGETTVLQNHQAYLNRAVYKLFQATPDDMKLCFVKQEVFGIDDGGPIIGADHPVMTEVFAIPIAGALCTYSNFRGVLARCFESADRCPGLAGNFQSKVLFETKGSEKLGETTVLQNRLHPSQQKIFDLLGTHCPPPSPFPPLFIRPSLACARAGACARAPRNP
jgi:hypothetical protein